MPHPLTETAVDALLERWVAFWNTYDLDQFDDLFVTDDTTSYFSSEYNGLIVGGAALRRHHAGFGFTPGGKISGNRLWLSATNIQLFGESAAVAALWHFQRAGADTEQSGPVTFVIAVRPEGLRIAHAHFANARP